MVRSSMRHLESYGHRPHYHSLSNRDPLSGEHGSHPIGTGIWAALGGSLAMALGATGGPVGAVIGAAIGSVVGGLVGKSASEAARPTVERGFWRRPYPATPNAPYSPFYEPYHPYQPSYHYPAMPPVEVGYRPDRGFNSDSERYSSRDDQDDQDLDYSPYDRYQPAYRLGYDSYHRYYHTGRTFDEIEPDLRREYEQIDTRLPWRKAKSAVRDAWYNAATEALEDRTLF